MIIKWENEEGKAASSTTKKGKGRWKLIEKPERKRKQKNCCWFVFLSSSIIVTQKNIKEIPSCFSSLFGDEN